MTYIVRCWWKAKAWRKRRKRCADCRIDIAPMSAPPGTWHWYMVRDEVWHEAGMCDEGYLCIACLERRLHRPLTVNDLLDAPVNIGAREMDVPTLQRLKEQFAITAAWRDYNIASAKGAEKFEMDSA